MQNPRHELGSVELLLLAGVIAFEATAVVVVALVALALTVARWSPPRLPAVNPPAGPALTPFAHPMVAVAEALQPLTCRELRVIAGTQRKCSKAQLIAAVLAS